VRERRGELHWKFEESIVRYANDFELDAVVCDHIHCAAIRKIGTLDYYNDGDWVESRMALVEHHDVRIELLINLALPPLKRRFQSRRRERLYSQKSVPATPPAV
jgi:UDP-2,3-diacylglucosamine pyrophosphatase LpxH